MIWNYPLDDIVRGYTEQENHMVCTMCDIKFEKGRIYEINHTLYDASGAIKQHTADEHGNTAAYLLKQDLGLTGITDVQRQILKLMLDGKSDKEIANEAGIVPSTVRNHRFKLREKEKQAKLFLALMNSLESETSQKIEKSDTGVIEEIHMTATMVDSRYNITDTERKKVIATYMDENGGLKQIPAKEKNKIILLREIVKNFNKNVTYSEKEVNRILKRIYEKDYPSIRRALIDYGFMERSADCKVYHVKE